MTHRAGAASSFAEVRSHFRSVLETTGDSAGMRICYRQSKESVDPKQPKVSFDPKQFLRHGLAAQILTLDELKTKVFGRVLHPRPGSEGIYVKRILGQESPASFDFPGSELRTILLIILCFGDQPMLNAFEANFLQNPCGKTDRDLPFDEYVAQQIFDSGGKQFFQSQFPFVPVTITEGNFRTEYQYLRNLPYLEHEEIGRGAFGRVFKVKIERGHYQYQQPRSRNQDVSHSLVSCIYCQKIVLTQSKVFMVSSQRL
jgi:hypothetical protein